VRAGPLGPAAHAVRVDPGDDGPVRNPELLPAFAAAFAVAIARLRWIALTKWLCRSCGADQLHCECKPAWKKLLL
jgi:hypothetical protein